VVKKFPASFVLSHLDDSNVLISGACLYWHAACANCRFRRYRRWFGKDSGESQCPHSKVRLRAKYPASDKVLFARRKVDAPRRRETFTRDRRGVSLRSGGPILGGSPNSANEPMVVSDKLRSVGTRNPWNQMSPGRM